MDDGGGKQYGGTLFRKRVVALGDYRRGRQTL